MQLRTLGAMLASILFWVCPFVLHAKAKSTPFMPQSWLFDWAPITELVPVPTVDQCETVNVTWNRESATGPSGTAPYRLVVYTSAFVVPIIVPAGDGPSHLWTVPFIPGTQFQVCMFDKNGNTGGCQRMYTVTSSRNETFGQPVSCQNVTYTPYDQVLDIDAQMDSGPISQYGWPDQCTDLMFTPKNGTPPYTLTVAPTLRTPYNVTWESKSLNWTIPLNWGSSFFFSIEDAKGNLWAQGPLHAGANGPTHCLDLNPPKAGVSHSVAVGASFGALIGGSLLGILLAWYWLYRRDHPRARTVQQGAADKRSFDDGDSAELGYGSGEGHRRSPSDRIDPFTQSTEGTQADTATVTSPATLASTSSGNVYVVHHDGGRPPVTVYTAEGTEVVELPPRYNMPDPSPTVQGGQQRPLPTMPLKQRSMRSLMQAMDEGESRGNDERPTSSGSQ